MHVFYTPDIQISNELPEEEAQHCTRVLRLGIGDEITLTDGKGNRFGHAICTLLWHQPKIWIAMNGLQRKLQKSDLMN